MMTFCKTNFALLFPPFVNPSSSIPTATTRFRVSFTTKICKRHRLITNATSSTTMELPLLPFSMEEVLVPSETKTLHLYEARYLALLEESLTRNNKLFVHFVLEPISIGDEFSTELSFGAKYECLVLIENVERLEVGALVSIRGLGRAKIVKFVQSEPYLKGIVTPVRDRITDNASIISSKVREVKEALLNLNSLEIKLKTSEGELLQTNVANSLAWAEKEPSMDCEDDFILPLTERISFAPYQPVSGSSKSELLKLNSEKTRAMDLEDTLKRLNSSLDLIKENISTVAAKLAIQSLDKQ